jgi:hypothetical protein
MCNRRREREGTLWMGPFPFTLGYQPGREDAISLQAWASRERASRRPHWVGCTSLLGDSVSLRSGLTSSDRGNKTPVWGTYLDVRTGVLYSQYESAPGGLKRSRKNSIGQISSQNNIPAAGFHSASGVLNAKTATGAREAIMPNR